jgi:hypothetical protein
MTTRVASGVTHHVRYWVLVHQDTGHTERFGPYDRKTAEAILADMRCAGAEANLYGGYTDEYIWPAEVIERRPGWAHLCK